MSGLSIKLEPLLEIDLGSPISVSMLQPKILLLTACMCPSAFGVLRTVGGEEAGGKVLYREDFEDDGRSLADRGWTVCRGISYERLRVSEIVTQMGAEHAATFTMQTGLGLQPSNRFYLDRMPSILSPGRDRVILLADLPLGPNNAMPAFLLEKIRDDVRSGSKLVVLGGPFTLGKGSTRAHRWLAFCSLNLAMDRGR